MFCKMLCSSLRESHGTDVMFDHPEFLRDYDAFAKAINHATEI